MNYRNWTWFGQFADLFARQFEHTVVDRQVSLNLKFYGPKRTSRIAELEVFNK